MIYNIKTLIGNAYAEVIGALLKIPSVDSVPMDYTPEQFLQSIIFLGLKCPCNEDDASRTYPYLYSNIGKPDNTVVTWQKDNEILVTACPPSKESVGLEEFGIYSHFFTKNPDLIKPDVKNEQCAPYKIKLSNMNSERSNISVENIKIIERGIILLMSWFETNNRSALDLVKGLRGQVNIDPNVIKGIFAHLLPEIYVHFIIMAYISRNNDRERAFDFLSDSNFSRMPENACKRQHSQKNHNGRIKATDYEDDDMEIGQY